jgi:predicted ArsR family transcriptional regulator
MAPGFIRLDTPAGKVLAQLREGPRTVEDLAKALHLTPNAVRNQLRKLQDANLVAQSGTRPSASKPSVLYAVTLEGEVQFSTIYLPILTQFLRVAEGQCSGKQLGSFMRDTGKSLAGRYEKPDGDLKKRVNSAARLLRSFGGLTEVRTENGGLVIRSGTCPLSALTSEHSAACLIFESFLASYIGATVRNCCSLERKPQCCFEVSA